MSYIDLDGIRTHYDVFGSGDPVVLLHGGLAGAESWFAQQQPLGDAGYQVHVPERRGHGRTPDVEGPLTYSVMADDTVRYLDAVVGGPAHLIGWSDGAVVAALVAMRRPDLARRIVLIGQYFDDDGKMPDGVVDGLAAWRTDPPDFLVAQYAATSPDGVDHLPVFLGKVFDMWDREPTIPIADFASITAPTLVLQGDCDDVTVEHSTAIARAVANGRLAVLPGTHALPVECPDVVNPLLLSFLAHDAPRVMGA
ncbi:alpha/beta fold hydrolase [Antrihabitans cavernicola]|uniref:Alpha/beta hydrolase n=1 Tax=Antrihabitans cavernicola TaxID=2495913 RepID=A0A5A7SG76_9NOCA|nr:alpha/beta hydrolase [Spelaeibacter cavernicola]KAA0023633.1 alpha/beta hydrolase [Spelaeibacter cavernicola]